MLEIVLTFCSIMYLQNVNDLKVEVDVSDLGLVGLLQGVIVLHSVI